jgi:large subunit ribosomal protein L15
MELYNLKPAGGSTHTKKRLGRGEGSGWGTQAGRGHKGAQSRSGYSAKAGFEGGQMPLQRRVPKFKVINLDTVIGLADQFGTSEITVDFLRHHGMVSRSALVKILGRGELNKALHVTAHNFSASAKSAIEAAGGTTTELNNY